MKTKMWVSLSAITVLILSFQNCAKTTVPTTSDVNGGPVSPPVKYNKYSVNEFTTMSLWDESRSRFLDLDLSNGQVAAFEEAGQVRGESYCLKDEQLVAAQTILSGAEICEPVVDAEQAQGQMCAMLYDYPYVTMVSQANQAKLGERTSSCDAPVDLCGQKAQQLRSWYVNIIAHITDGSVTKNCQ